MHGLCPCHVRLLRGGPVSDSPLFKPVRSKFTVRKCEQLSTLRMFSDTHHGGWHLLQTVRDFDERVGYFDERVG